MNRILFLLILVAFAFSPFAVSASVEPVAGGFQVSYDIRLTSGSSNGSDIVDTTIFEWNEADDFNVETGFTIAGRGATNLTHVIGFEPAFALVIGWGAAIPGKGDEKDHLFTLTNDAFATQVTGKKWSEAFPGVPPVPRTGHNAMIGLLQAAGSGDEEAINALAEFVQREAESAAFNPAGHFRILEWTIAKPLDVPLPVPVMPLYGLGLLILGFLMLARHFLNHRNYPVSD